MTTLRMQQMAARLRVWTGCLNRFLSWSAEQFTLARCARPCTHSLPRWVQLCSLRECMHELARLYQLVATCHASSACVLTTVVGRYHHHAP